MEFLGGSTTPSFKCFICHAIPLLGIDHQNFDSCALKVTTILSSAAIVYLNRPSTVISRRRFQNLLVMDRSWLELVDTTDLFDEYFCFSSDRPVANLVSIHLGRDLSPCRHDSDNRESYKLRNTTN